MKNLMIRVVLIALLAFAAPPVRAADPAADEVKRLQGEWQVVEIESRGNKAPKGDDAMNMRLVFKGNDLTIANRGRERKNTFKLDPSKTPKEMDITSSDRPIAPPNDPDQIATTEGIYKLEGDRLTICMAYFNKDKASAKRPTEFKAGTDTAFMLLTLERASAK